jgi:hypothetical protein
MADKVLIATPMRMGDSLHVLPIASWIHKTTGAEIDWAYSKMDYSGAFVEILRNQKCIKASLSFDYDAITPWDGKELFSCWRPYNCIDRELHKLTHNYYDQIYCFAYDRRAYEQRRIEFFSEHFAREFGLGVDYGFQLNYNGPDPQFADKTVKLDKFYAPELKTVGGFELPESISIIKNLQYCAGAKQVISARSGSAVALSLARIPFMVKMNGDQNEWEFYLRVAHGITGGIERYI